MNHALASPRDNLQEPGWRNKTHRLFLVCFEAPAGCQLWPLYLTFQLWKTPPSETSWSAGPCHAIVPVTTSRTSSSHPPKNQFPLYDYWTAFWEQLRDWRWIAVLWGHPGRRWIPADAHEWSEGEHVQRIWIANYNNFVHISEEGCLIQSQDSLE